MQIGGGGGSYAGATPAKKAASPTNFLQSVGMAAPAPTGPVAPTSFASAARLPASPAGPIAPYSPSAPSSGAGQTLGTNSQGTVSGISSGGGAAGGGGTSAAPPAQPMTNDAWWNQDANFQAEQGGLSKTLANAMDAYRLKREGYDSDYVTALKNMGLDWSGAQSNSLDGLDQGQFNQQNQLGAYGRGYQNMQNDFASRGMLDSSFYDMNKQNFNTDFLNQRSGLGRQRDQYLGDINNQQQGAQNDYTAALERARQSSLSRRQIAGV